MRILDNMEACYGCGACANVCPTGAVSMKENAEGFMEPAIDAEKCVACGKCRQVCPAVNCRYPNDPEPDIYAFSAEEKLLYESSSGGIFTFLAECVLKKGGYVAGAAYDEKFRVNHIIIHHMEELDLLRRSKYLQSSTGDTFQRVKELLEEENYVLYSGSPCQIAGLLRFLGKSYEKLYTVDVLCHGVPSPKLFEEHLCNSYGGVEKIEDVEFRSREGWGTLFRVKLKNGEARTSYINRSVYLKSFLQDINLRASCFQCQYSRLPRQGDITIGDLWAAGEMKLSFEYKKGVSAVLLNNEKGRALFRESLSGSGYQFHSQKIYGKDADKNCDKRLLNTNIFYPSAAGSDVAKRREFFRNCKEQKFERAFYATQHKYDVGLILFMSDNYGSIATNYALYNAVNGLGKKAAVLEHWGRRMGDKAFKFAKRHMKLTGDFMETGDWQAANWCFDTFIVGSDVSWNWRANRISHIFQYMMLGFADENKRMISYAPSFGGLEGKKDIDAESRALGAYSLNRFDAISVREDYGVDMCRDLFDVEATQVLDPVWICDKKIWNELSVMSQLKFEEEYLLAYILDPTPEKRQAILETAHRLNVKPVVILDQEFNTEAARRIMNLDEELVTPEFTDWLAYFQHAGYVITDSMHGTCFAALFGKKFVSIKNRSKERFTSLAEMLGCPELFYEDAKQLLGKTDIFKEIDYEAVNRRIESKRAESLKWLRSALDIKVKQKSGNESTKLMLQLYDTLSEKTDLLNKMQTVYAYEEEQRMEISAQLKSGNTWLEIVCERNGMDAGNSEFREIGNLREYFAKLKANEKYVAVLSCKDECASQWGGFLEAVGLPLRKDVFWRNSYAAVIDGGVIRIDSKADNEINVNYEFVAGHSNYSVEYLDGRLKVCCEPLRYCKIKIKSKGYTVSPGRDRSEIIVDNIDYSMNKTGINIVVIDKEMGTVADSINVNTYADPGLRINRG